LRAPPTRLGTLIPVDDELRSVLKVVRRAPLAIEAAAALTAASIAVRVLSHARVTQLLGRPSSRELEYTIPESPEPQAPRVARAVSILARWLPWHPTCLPQAIATRWMLRRRAIPCEAHLGIVSTAPMMAHAWVTVRGTVVQGGPVTGHELARFR
jgi:hypothetical protein